MKYCILICMLCCGCAQSPSPDKHILLDKEQLSEDISIIVKFTGGRTGILERNHILAFLKIISSSPNRTIVGQFQPEVGMLPDGKFTLLPHNRKFLWRANHIEEWDVASGKTYFWRNPKFGEAAIKYCRYNGSRASDEEVAEEEISFIFDVLIEAAQETVPE